MHHISHLTLALVPVSFNEVVHASFDLVDDEEQVGTQICASGREGRLELYEWLHYWSGRWDESGG